jgi:hypothetical protein
MKAAVFSYNTFASGQTNGLHVKDGNSVLLIQNISGDTWGAAQFGRSDQMEAEGASLVDQLWGQLEVGLPELDHVVIYVGSHGAERAIERAGACGLDPTKATFVFCDCGKAKKQEMLRRHGFGSSSVIDSECGGHEAMLRAYDSLLESGTL